MPSPISERIARRIETEVMYRTIPKEDAHAPCSPDAANDIRTAMALVQHQAAGKE